MNKISLGNGSWKFSSPNADNDYNYKSSSAPNSDSIKTNSHDMSKANHIVDHMQKEVGQLYDLHYGYYSLEQLDEALQHLSPNV